MMKQKNNRIGIVLTVIILLLICLLCLCLVAVTTGLIVFNASPWENLFRGNTSEATPTSPAWPTSIPTDSREIEEPNNPSYIPMDGANQSLETLLEEVVPINDSIDLAERLGGKTDIPDLFPDPNQPYQIGDSKTFWVSNTDTNESFQVTAVLRYLGDHLYFWIEDGIIYDTDDLNNLSETFDNEIYPTTREFFGSEWYPGVDQDPHIYVLYASGLGDSIAGYYSSADELHPAAHLYSNAHEMFLMNSDTVDLDEDYIYGTMAHEFQHMIHWYNDRNEDTWLNEGFSMLSELLNEYDGGGFDSLYSENTDLQLTDWSGDTDDNGPHYGASFLFTTYFLDRFGEQATKALVSHPKNGMTSLAAVTQELNLVNPDTGKPYTSNEFFADWTVTNYLLDGNVENGRYDYVSYSPESADTSETISSCAQSRVRDVYQFGVNYLEFDCAGEHTLLFTGVPQVGILPMGSEYSGKYFFWSNMGDDSNSRLTHEFDLTSSSSPISMSYKTWYDLEDGYDYVFLSATTDGESWQILNTTTCTTSNPSGNSYGCGYTGSTNGWIEERVDLSQFAGQKVTLRFDYVTDAAVNGIGLTIDDIRIDPVGYFTDFETDEGGWDGEGFVRIQNGLPQTYNLSLIEVGDQTAVRQLPLDENNTAEIRINIDGQVNRVILVVSGTTPITRERAIYRVEIK